MKKLSKISKSSNHFFVFKNNAPESRSDGDSLEFYDPQNPRHVAEREQKIKEQRITETFRIQAQ